MKHKHVLMGDTDSSYCRLDLYANAHGLSLDRDSAVTIADNLQAVLQADLPDILAKKFITRPETLAILEPGRETVGRKALFKDKKKRYAIHVVDDEGHAADKLKIIGMETRRSDTPVFIQEFLLHCLERVVQRDDDYDALRVIVDEFRTKFRQMDVFRQGSPGRVKNLNAATAAYNAWSDRVNTGRVGGKIPQMHVTVKAALSTNRLMDHHNETRWGKIRDGDKVEVLYLTDNPERLDCVAIRTGEDYIPDWFRELPFDAARMEEKLLDRKLFNVIGDILGWDFTPATNYADEAYDEDDFYA